MAEIDDLRGAMSRLEARNRRLEGLYEAARELGAAADTETVLHSLLARALRALDSGCGAILLLDPEDDKLWVKASLGGAAPIGEDGAIALGEGIAGWIGRERQALRLEDVNADQRFAMRDRERRITGPLLGAPLISRERLAGVIEIWGRHGEEGYAAEDLEILLALAGVLALAIDNTHLFEESLASSYLDSMTGLYNHATFQNLLERELDRAERYARPLSLLLVDIDEFKLYNDRYGHPAGSKAIRTIAQIICAQSRTSDIVSRYGGDQFAVLLPETDPKSALIFAEKVRASVDAHYFPGSAGDLAEHLTISLGVAAYPEDADSHVSLLDMAEGALFASKFAGKNRVSSAQDI